MRAGVKALLWGLMHSSGMAGAAHAGTGAPAGWCGAEWCAGSGASGAGLYAGRGQLRAVRGAVRHGGDRTVVIGQRRSHLAKVAAARTKLN